VSAANDKVWEPRLKWVEFELSVVMAKEKGEQDEEEGARFKYSKTGTGVAEQEFFPTWVTPDLAMRWMERASLRGIVCPFCDLQWDQKLSLCLLS